MSEIQLEECPNCGASIDPRRMLRFHPDESRPFKFCPTCGAAIAREMRSSGCPACAHGASYLEMAVSEVDRIVAVGDSVEQEMVPSLLPHDTRCRYQPAS